LSSQSVSTKAQFCRNGATRDRAYGFVFEPSYTYSFATGHEQSIGFNVSLVIPLR